MSKLNKPIFYIDICNTKEYNVQTCIDICSNKDEHCYNRCLSIPHKIGDTYINVCVRFNQIQEGDNLNELQRTRD